MALNLSIGQFVIVTLSVLAIILGVFFLFNLETTSKEAITQIPPNLLVGNAGQSSRVDVTVTPPTSAVGTIFSIIAETWPKKETQEISLLVESDEISEDIVLYDDGLHYDEQASDGIYGGTFDSINLPLGEYAIKDENKTELSTLTLFKPGCEPVIGGASPDKINFVILPAKYVSYEQFKQDAISIFLGAGSLSEIEPFKSNFDKFSFVLVNTSRNLGCELGCQGVASAVCCNDQIVNEEASQCHYDEIIVLINAEEKCGSASYYAKVCPNSELSKLILAHELGHSFGGLADEYVYSETFEDYNVPDSFVLKSANCDTEGCSKWSAVTSDCYEGCTSPSLYRPSANSIMRYVSFGEFNEVSRVYLKGLIDKYLDKENDATERQWKSYSANLHYSNGKTTLSPVSIKPVKAGFQLGQQGFLAKVKDSSGSLLYETDIPLPLIDYPALEISDKPIINSEINVPLILPFNLEANELEVSLDGETVATTSLAIFSNKCGNSVCDAGENHISCSTDCDVMNDNFCESAQCDPDCPSQKDCLKTKKGYFWPILLIILALVALITVFVKLKKN